jgi:hypothetical protein
MYPNLSASPLVSANRNAVFVKKWGISVGLAGLASGFRLEVAENSIVVVLCFHEARPAGAF